MRTESFSTPGALVAEVRVPAGRIELDAGDRAVTEVELVPLGRDGASSEAVEAAHVELRERASGGQLLTIDVRAGRRSGLFSRGGEVLVRIRCPEGTDLEAEGGSTDVEAVGRLGTVRITTASGDVELPEVAREASVRTASGDVELGTVAGEARVSTASGDVSITQLGGRAEVNAASGDVRVDEARGPLEVQSASGDVVVREAAASLNVRTASGDQRVDTVSSGEVSLQSASGDIRIGVKPGTKLWVDARSRSGEATSDLDVGDAPPEEGAPQLELRASSMSGDIHVGRA